MEFAVAVLSQCFLNEAYVPGCHDGLHDFLDYQVFELGRPDVKGGAVAPTQGDGSGTPVDVAGGVFGVMNQDRAVAVVALQELVQQVWSGGYGCSHGISNVRVVSLRSVRRVVGPASELCAASFREIGLRDLDRSDGPYPLLEKLRSVRTER